jgi:hypothetical protein
MLSYQLIENNFVLFQIKGLHNIHMMIKNCQHKILKLHSIYPFDTESHLILNNHQGYPTLLTTVTSIIEYKTILRS